MIGSPPCRFLSLICRRAILGDRSQSRLNRLQVDVCADDIIEFCRLCRDRDVRASQVDRAATSCCLASRDANAILGDRSRRPLSVDGVKSCVVGRGEWCRFCRDSRGDRRLAGADDVSDMAEAAKMAMGANENCWPTRTTQKLQGSGDARSGSAIRREVGMAWGGWLGIGLSKNGYIHLYTYQVGRPFSTDFRSKCGGGCLPLRAGG